MIRALALTGGATVPSARFRIRQFVGRLESFGVQLDERPSRVGMYPPPGAAGRPWWLVRTVLDRVPAVAATHAADVTVLQRELVSTLSTLEGLTHRPRVLDVDDALWLLPRGAFAGRLARRVARVIAGNAYLAEYFGRHCRDVVVLPTAVDTDRYVPAPRSVGSSVRIGWSGSSAGFPYLVSVQDALARALAALPHARLVVMADRPPVLPSIPPDRLDFVRWTPDTEVPTLQSFDIGLMPLIDGDWERGKCSFKMLQYLACGVPAVVSPVGMNRDVLAAGAVGIGAATADAWVEALVALARDPALRTTMGTTGRAVVERDYSVTAVAPRLAAAIAGVTA